MIDAGTSHSMIRGLTPYITSMIAIANANGNHNGAFRNPTAAKPMPITSPERPASEGRERRQTKLIVCLLERTDVERLLT